MLINSYSLGHIYILRDHAIQWNIPNITNVKIKKIRCQHLSGANSQETKDQRRNSDNSDVKLRIIYRVQVYFTCILVKTLSYFWFEIKSEIIKCNIKCEKTDKYLHFAILPQYIWRWNFCVSLYPRVRNGSKVQSQMSGLMKRSRLLWSGLNYWIIIRPQYNLF